MPEPQSPARSIAVSSTPAPVLELTSALTQNDAKRQIVCPPELTVTQKEFYDAFASQLTRNRLPARATLQRISWDHGQRPQEVITVAFTGQESPAEVVRIVVGFKQMGSFVYVERMLTFLPPKLPAARNRKNQLATKSSEVDSVISGIGCGALLVIAAVLGLIGSFILSIDGGGFGIIFVIPAVLLAIWAVMIQVGNADKSNKTKLENAEIATKNAEIAKWNQLADQEKRQLDAAADQWSKKVGEFFFLTQVDDVFGRWISAVSLTLDQVIKQLFVDRQAQAEAWEVQQKTQKEIEAQMQKLRESSMQ